MELKVRNSGGSLILSREGSRVEAAMDCPRDDRGLFRGYLICPGGEIMLGVLEPREERMVLRRTLLQRELEPLGEPQAGESRMSFAFRQPAGWQRVRRPEEVLPAGELAGRLRRWEGGLWKRERGRTLLALPYSSKKPFPMTELFCFARVQAIGQEQYAVFAFDREGYPVAD